MRIYIVYASTGEYEDRTQWNIMAYPTKELALTHIKVAEDELNKLLQRLNIKRDRYEEVSSSSDIKRINDELKEYCPSYFGVNAKCYDNLLTLDYTWVELTSFELSPVTTEQIS